MINRGMFSSATDEWATPQSLYEQLDAEFHFTLDPCATPENAKCESFFTRGLVLWVRDAWEAVEAAEGRLGRLAAAFGERGAVA